MDMEHPASLSKEVHRLLREDMGFEGVIMTDDLAMEAINLFTGGEHAAGMALRAGNDLLIITDLAGGYAAVLEAIYT